MIAVAIDAAGSQIIAAGKGLAVQRFGMFGLLRRMAGAALHLLGRGMRQIDAFEVGMAVGAGKAAMHGGGKLLAVHVKRNRPPAVLRSHRLFTVTAEAEIVWIPVRSLRSARRQRDAERQKSRHYGHALRHAATMGDSLQNFELQSFRFHKTQSFNFHVSKFRVSSSSFEFPGSDLFPETLKPNPCTRRLPFN